MAKRGLADEYDAAQDRGEIRVPNERTTSNAETVSVSEIGFSHKEIHEARLIRNAEVAEPGIVRRVLDERIAGASPHSPSAVALGKPQTSKRSTASCAANA